MIAKCASEGLSADVFGLGNLEIKNAGMPESQKNATPGCKLRQKYSNIELLNG